MQLKVVFSLGWWGGIYFNLFNSNRSLFLFSDNTSQEVFFQQYILQEIMFDVVTIGKPQVANISGLYP